MFKKESRILKCLYFGYIFIDLLAFLYGIRVFAIEEKIFFISFIMMLIICAFCIIYTFIKIDLRINLFNNYKCQKFFFKLFINFNFLILYIIIFCRFLLDSIINIPAYDEYLRICPFTIDNNESYHEDRVCKLYNIYNNSRYRYQYICSYKAKKLSYDDVDKIICIPKVKNNTNNDIIEKFSLEHKNKKLYYCSRNKRPKKDEFIKDEYCNKTINTPILFFFIDCICYIILLIYHYPPFHTIETFFSYTGLNEEQNNNPRSISDVETQYSEKNINNIPYIQQDDKNIILENNKEYEVEVNIKNFMENKDIAKQIMNSEENSIGENINDSNTNFKQ